MPDRGRPSGEQLNGIRSGHRRDGKLVLGLQAQRFATCHHEFTPGHSSIRPVTTSAAEMTRSKLSSAIASGLFAQVVPQGLEGTFGPLLPHAEGVRRGGGDKLRVSREASEMKAAPLESGPSSDTICNARRVLPMPPVRRGSRDAPGEQGLGARPSRRRTHQRRGWSRIRCPCGCSSRALGDGPD